MKRLLEIPLHAPLRISARAPSGDARLLMQWIGAQVAIVCQDGPDDPIGTLWKEDLDSAIGTGGGSAGALPVARVMKETVDACYQSQTLVEAAALVRARCAPLLAVFDEDEALRGVVFADDVLREAERLSRPTPLAVRPARRRRCLKDDSR